MKTNRHNSEIITFRHNLNFSLVSLRNARFHIGFPKHNLDFLLVSLKNTWFHIVFPKHNLDFPPVSLRNTRFHVILMGKHKHKTVQWVWNSLKLITKAKKNQYIWRFSQNSTVGILYWKMSYCMFSILSVLYRLNQYMQLNFDMIFFISISNFQRPIRYFPIRDCAFFQSHPCLIYI